MIVHFRLRNAVRSQLSAGHSRRMLSGRAIVRNLRSLIIEKRYNYTTTQRQFWLFSLKFIIRGR